MQRLRSCGDGSNHAMNQSPVDPYSVPQQRAAKSYGFNAFNAFNSPINKDSASFSQSPSSCNEDNNPTATENRLYLARLTLEYQQIVARYGICLNHLQESVNEGEKLREENAALRIANKDLTKRLTLLTEISIRNRYLSPGFPSLSIINDFRNLSVGDGGRVNGHHVSGDVSDNKSPTSVIESNRFEKKNGERVTLPKSISVRSSGYLKANPAAAGGSTSTTAPTNRFRSLSPVKTETQRVFVPGGNQEEEALEFDVYNQGMFKTELCNKWQETGACPYGDHCQFAHGINELRPVIRHPRYKTEVCRMVLAGDPCPYGHRCHFRHALTEQERLTGRS